jgi:hypothetical protein
MAPASIPVRSIAIELDSSASSNPSSPTTRSLHASDVDAVDAVYEAPLLALRDGKVIHVPDRAAFVSIWRSS